MAGGTPEMRGLQTIDREIALVWNHAKLSGATKRKLLIELKKERKATEANILKRIEVLYEKPMQEMRKP